MSMGLGRPILTQADLQQHITALATQDVIYAPIFDSASYGTAGVTQLVFFTSPIGQGTTTAPGGATGTKTLADTNMTSAGQLSKGNDFFMIGQELMFFPGQTPETSPAIGAANGFLNDTYAVGKSGFLTLQIGSNRQYIQDGPLMLFPPSARLAVAAAIGGNFQTAGTNGLNEAMYATWAGEPYAITPVYIEATQGFQEVLQWPAAVTISATARMVARLRGYLVRQAQ
jgi:hypothetical protein